MDEMVEVSWTELCRLRDRDDFLSCLEAYGVDNWDGYGDAQDLYEEENSNG